ncbi:glutamate racemase [Desulfurivibrio alkaliphilus]|uniref:Glutamate racemase n=1 Tax=Desulfurivibrio alkaliphilus (strain DSM 19089 / UNIQEM U267 / AHT2) TaxID=589865 RepID=D6Z6M8_DESAT|nr:glutamate racemase [Desulfurivibrio alkaliphilus]ADH84987.1 glutamate racemase [Desulfurivibrio alkaliphilus AHT 2]
MIGVFDSGVGGMTVARAIEQALPDYRLVYFGDLARTPYGSKSSDTISRYSCQNVDFLLSRGAKIIVVACNSAASVAAANLRAAYDLPIFEVIGPAVAQAARFSSRGRVGVIGTRATIRSGVYEQLLQQQNAGCRVFSAACPLLVPLVEEGWLDKRETKMILRRYLAPLKQQQVDTLVLGCTHYPLLKELIQRRIGRRVRVIDSSQALAAELAAFLNANPAVATTLSRREEGENLYYVSDVTEAAHHTARRIFGRSIDLRAATGTGDV